MADDSNSVTTPRGGPPGKKIPQGRGYDRADRDPREFAESQMARLDRIGGNRGPMPELPWNDQRLVFKIKTNRPADDEDFRRDLEGTGCDTIDPVAGGKPEWIMATDDAGFAKLKKRLRKRADEDEPSFVDAINGFDEFEAKAKIGKRLAANPLKRTKAEKIFVSLSRIRPGRDKLVPSASLALIQRLAYDRGFAVHRERGNGGLYFVVLDANQEFLDLLIRIDAVASVDRPPLPPV